MRHDQSWEGLAIKKKTTDNVKEAYLAGVCKVSQPLVDGVWHFKAVKVRTRIGTDETWHVEADKVSQPQLMKCDMLRLTR